MKLQLDEIHLNDLQIDAIRRLIARARQAHFTDIRLRINGEYEIIQADWLKHLKIDGEPMSLDDMATILIANRYQVKPPGDPATCKHERQRGCGSMSSDGSSSMHYYCPDCGNAWNEEIKGVGATAVSQDRPRPVN